jgi:hypothetical protein
MSAPMADEPSGSPAGMRRAPNRLPLWLTVIVILGALGVISLAFGALFFPKTLLASGQQMNAAARVWARYAAAYSAALSISMVVLLAVRARWLLAGVLVQAAFAELLLAVVGVTDRRWDQIGADIVLAVAFIACASHLFGGPAWRPGAWREPAPPG